MDIYSCQEAFGASDKTTSAMRDAISQWYSLYYRDTVENGEDPCQRIAYTVVSKLVRTVFAEYAATAEKEAAQKLLNAIDPVREQAVAQALVGGECYLKPWISGNGFAFTVVPRNSILIFSRDARGEPVDVGTMERSTLGNAYYTLLERRTVDEKGYLTIENRLYRSLNADSLGSPVLLSSHPDYKELADCYTYEAPVGSVGLVRVKTPMLNCVDGSADGVSVYAAAVGLIRALDQNEHQLSGEFERGQSRVFVSSDLLDGKTLKDNLFVGLDEAPDRVGITLFSPELRSKAYLERKQEYLRNLESLIGIKRGLLCDANLDQRTATEISASQTEHALTVMDFQNMWSRAVESCVELCRCLAGLYSLDAIEGAVRFDWGNGVLYDEEKRWEDYKQMVTMGLIAPEVALGWRFGMRAETPQERQVIRQMYMPTEVDP